MGRNCYRCRLLEFVAARISRIQFAQRYVICIYGVRITFVLFTPVPETGCPMWHAGLTLTLTLTFVASLLNPLITTGQSRLKIKCFGDMGFQPRQGRQTTSRHHPDTIVVKNSLVWADTFRTMTAAGDLPVYNHSVPGGSLLNPAKQRCKREPSFGKTKWNTQMVGLHVSVLGGGNVDADITYHLQVAARAFYSNKGTLLDKNVSANLKLTLFDATVTPIACFAAGIAVSDNITFTSSMLKSEDWCRQ